MTILVTRPSPAGEQLVSRLQASGLSAYHAPLINFSKGKGLPQLPNLLQSLRTNDLGFLVSQQAVYYTNEWLNENKYSWPCGMSWYAIGHTTASTLYTVSGLHAVFPPIKETSEMLLSLPALQNVRGKKALILRGNSGRELLGKTLTLRGAEVIWCECYQRNSVHYDGDQQSLTWQQAGVDTLIVTSGEMLQQLYTLIPDYYRSSWLLHCKLVVVSDRLAALASQLGWYTIRVAENADNDALICALQ